MRPSFVLLLLAAAACSATTQPAGSAPGGVPASPGSPTPPAPPPVAPPAPTPTAPVATLPASPWSAAPVGWSEIPRAYRTAWDAAENRTSCAPIAPARPPAPSGAPRTAYFSGGWAVAYDLPETRSAYGVAGTGASATGVMYTGFPHRIEWSDGSVARYGPEGGTGPNQMAYVTIPGQTCLYNVWSRLGVAHLEQLLASLRYVR